LVILKKFLGAVLDVSYSVLLGLILGSLTAEFLESVLSQSQSPIRFVSNKLIVQ
jgi:hypothetical protein